MTTFPTEPASGSRGDPLHGVEITPREINTHTDTRDILAHARQQIISEGLDKYFIVDVDSHHSDLRAWLEIAQYMDDPVIRANAIQHTKDKGYPAYFNYSLGMAFQDVFGRIPHQAAMREDVDDDSVHRDVTMIRRAMDSMGIDVQVVFPTGLLSLGLSPLGESEEAFGFAYNRWFCENILAEDDRIKGLLFLPFQRPEAALRTIREFADKPGVIGFLVTSVREKPVHDNEYMPVYAELQERGLPLAFHAGPTWDDVYMRAMNRFLSVHAISFVLCNMVHLTNWIVNGIPERFPNLDVIWVESGLAWVPFMMQRLDNEYMMRQSDAPLLKRKPSEYMREMYYTTQPMERTDDDLLAATFKAINAREQLLYSSDWPHWDFDLPSSITTIPFLDEEMKRNILGENARRLFKL
jgi:predicted TIM-barrel fold metal-dependent hydrolase